MEDVRLGRVKYFDEKIVALAAGANTPILGPDPKRTYVQVTSPKGNTFFLSASPMTATETGVRFGPVDSPNGRYSVEDFGSFVTGPLFVWNNGAADSVHVLTVSLGKE